MNFNSKLSLVLSETVNDFVRTLNGLGSRVSVNDIMLVLESLTPDIQDIIDQSLPTLDAAINKKIIEKANSAALRGYNNMNNIRDAKMRIGEKATQDVFYNQVTYFTRQIMPKATSQEIDEIARYINSRITNPIDLSDVPKPEQPEQPEQPIQPKLPEHNQ